MSPKSLIVITGPTASGKSALAVQLAKQLSGEVVNADSVAVYRRFDIGSGKPSPEVLQAVPHHLVSVLEPVADYNAYIFSKQAREQIKQIWERGNLAIIAGGTGLYIRALLNGMAEIPPITDAAQSRLRDLVGDLAAVRDPSPILHAALSEADPQAAEEISASDVARMRRALLVKWSSGRSIRSYQAEFCEGPKMSALILVMNPERDWLYGQINQRAVQMMSDGLVEETQAIVADYGYGPKALGSLGYSHACQYMSGALDLKQSLEAMQRDTRHFAKRQMTWWNNQPSKLGWEVRARKTLGFSRVEQQIEQSQGDILRNALCECAITEISEFLSSSCPSLGPGRDTGPGKKRARVECVFLGF